MSIAVYAQPVSYMIAEIILIPFLWAVIANLTSGKALLQRIINTTLLLASIYLIVKVTLLGRTPNESSRFFGIPLQLVFASIRGRRELVRSILLNILLFAPFGSALVFLLPERKAASVRLIITCCAGMMLSVLIECAQYQLALGNAEVDDVICNSLGTMVGALALPINAAISAIRNEKGKEQAAIYDK